MKLTGNTVFIPGATSGLGLALARALHGVGNTMIVGGRRTELLASIAKDNPGIETVRIDTSDTGDIADVSAALQSRFPDLNVVILMAGIMRAEDLTSADFLPTAELEVVTNILGPLRLIAAFTEFLADKPGATIITVSSGLAFTPMPATPTYNATKAAIHSFSETARIQLATKGIQVLELAPPAVQTDLMPGQADAQWAMPLDEFIDEVMTLLPDATDEILVDNVKPLRNSVINGNYDELVSMLGSLG